MARRRFRGTPLATLQSMHTALVAHFTGTGTVAGGLKAYTIAGRSVEKFDLNQLADLLNDVSDEIAIRSNGQPDEIGFADVQDGQGNQTGPLELRGY